MGEPAMRLPRESAAAHKGLESSRSRSRRQNPRAPCNRDRAARHSQPVSSSVSRIGFAVMRVDRLRSISSKARRSAVESQRSIRRPVRYAMSFFQRHSAPRNRVLDRGHEPCFEIGPAPASG